MEKQSKMVTENEAQFVDEIRGVRERAKRKDLKIIKVKKKEYEIKLTFDELEFIRRSIDGINQFLKCLHGDRQENSWVLYQLYGEIELEDIELVELEDKIYKQYHDEDGTIKKPETIIDLTNEKPCL